MLNPYVLLGIGVAWLLSIGVAFWQGDDYRDAKWKAAQAVAQDQARKEFDRKLVAANQIADQLEKTNVAIRAASPKPRVIDRIVERPSYRNVCLDADGLRAANLALTGRPPDPAQPDAAVPGSGTAR